MLLLSLYYKVIICSMFFTFSWGWGDSFKEEENPFLYFPAKKFV